MDPSRKERESTQEQAVLHKYSSSQSLLGLWSNIGYSSSSDIENKENMSERANMTTTSDNNGHQEDEEDIVPSSQEVLPGAPMSMQLRLEDTMALEDQESEDRSCSELTSQQPSLQDQYGDCSQKPLLDSSAGSDVQAIQDDSVIIEDSPVVAKKNISLIVLNDSHDSSLKLELSDTQSNGMGKSPLGSTPGHKIVHTSPMSEILASNSLLYQNVDNINKVIDADEDLQSMYDHPVMDLDHSREDGDVFMLDKHQGVSDFGILSPKKSKKESWSPKKEIWSAKNEKKRKAKEASLSSGDESSKKKIDVKDEKSDMDAPSSKYTKLMDPAAVQSADDDELKKLGGSETELQKLGSSTEAEPESRPGSSQCNNLQSPDISCSPIASLDPGGPSDSQGTRRTSTPGHSGGLQGPVLSSPQKQLRKKLQKELIDSPQGEGGRSEGAQEVEETETQFKAPSPVSCSINTMTITFSDPKLMQNFKENSHLPEVQRAKEVFEKYAGCTLNLVVETTARINKRLSDVSSLSKSSSGGSSGYLAGSSSGSSATSGRSRLSLAPETSIEPHRVVSKLPGKTSATPRTDSVEVQAESLEPVCSVANVEFVDDNQVRVIESQSVLDTIDEEKVGEAMGPVASEGVRKKNTKSIKESKPSKKVTKESTPNKKLTKKRVKSRKPSAESSPPQEEEQVEDEADDSQSNDRYGVGNKVFARWVDGTGVYFYGAEIIATVNEEEVRVMFLEDKIKKVMKKETEVISTSQLQPGDQVTVKHSIYQAYEVSASLMSYPVRTKGGDMLYEISISATESEPSPNEDSRTVSHHEVSLTDGQACAVLRKLGLIPSSNKVSANINFENMIFSKRKARGSTPLKADQDTPSKGRTPRKKRGGENVEESAPTNHDSSTADTSPVKGEKEVEYGKKLSKGTPQKVSRTPKRDPRTPKSVAGTTPRRQGRGGARPLSTDEEEEEVLPRTARRMQGAATVNKVEAVPKLSTPSARARPLKSDQFFHGLSFVLTQAKTGAEQTSDPDEDSYSESEPARSTSEPKFDRKKLCNLISAYGGDVLPEFPCQGLEDQDTEVVAVSDVRCVTMTYLLSLAHQVPVVSHVFILDCVAGGSMLDRTAYLLPAGFSTLLMKEVEQRQDCRQELRINDCLLPSPPATSTRLSNRSKEEDNTGRKILSGLHVLVLSLDKDFTDDWQAVLDSLGAAVTKRSSTSARLAQLRLPDVVVTDNKAPPAICQDLTVRNDIPVVSTNWVIQCVINNARIAYNNFRRKLPSD